MSPFSCQKRKGRWSLTDNPVAKKKKTKASKKTLSSLTPGERRRLLLSSSYSLSEHDAPYPHPHLDPCVRIIKTDPLPIKRKRGRPPKKTNKKGGDKKVSKRRKKGGNSSPCFICGGGGSCGDDGQPDEEKDLFMSSFCLPLMKDEILSPDSSTTCDETMTFCASCTTVLRRVERMRRRVEQLQEGVANALGSIRAVVKMRVEEADAQTQNAIEEEDSRIQWKVAGPRSKTKTDKNSKRLSTSISECDQWEDPQYEPFPFPPHDDVVRIKLEQQDFDFEYEEPFAYDLDSQLDPPEPEPESEILETETPVAPPPPPTSNSNPTSPSLNGNSAKPMSLFVVQESSRGTSISHSPGVGAVQYKPIQPKPLTLLNQNPPRMGKDTTRTIDNHGPDPPPRLVNEGVGVGVPQRSGLFPTDTLVVFPDGSGLLFQPPIPHDPTNVTVPTQMPIPAAGNGNILAGTESNNVKVDSSCDPKVTSLHHSLLPTSTTIPPAAPSQAADASLKPVPAGPDGTLQLAISFQLVPSGTAPAAATDQPHPKPSALDEGTIFIYPKCPKCDRCFIGPSYLKKHVCEGPRRRRGKQGQDEVKRPINVDNSSSNGASSTARFKHQFTCSNCGRSFIGLSYLQRHEEVCRRRVEEQKDNHGKYEDTISHLTNVKFKKY